MGAEMFGLPTFIHVLASEVRYSHLNQIGYTLIPLSLIGLTIANFGAEGIVISVYHNWGIFVNSGTTRCSHFTRICFFGLLVRDFCSRLSFKLCV